MTPRGATRPVATPPDLAGTWRATRAVVCRHFDIFATLAAAFVFLPSVIVHVAVFPAMVVGMTDPLHPATLPPGLLLATAGVLLVNMLAWFTIAAVAADPDEGAGRPVGATLRVALPAIGRAIVCGLLLFAAAFASVFVLLLIGGIVGVAAGMGTPAKAATAAVTGLAGIVGAVAVAVGIWVSARLAPLVGVLLREPLRPGAAILRAWGLSRGAGSRIVLIVIAATVTTLVAQLAITGTGHLFGLRADAFVLTLLRDVAAALISVYYYAAIGIVYRQLTEVSPI